MDHIVTFPTISDAMGCEKAVKDTKWVGELIPIPEFLNAGCGFSFHIEDVGREDIEKLLEKNDVKWQEIIEVKIENNKILPLE